MKTIIDFEAQAESDLRAARQYRDLMHAIAKTGKFAGGRRSRQTPTRNDLDAEWKPAPVKAARSRKQA